jgi:hypothetical protein
MRVRRAFALSIIAVVATMALPAGASPPAHVSGAQAYAAEDDPCFDPSALFSLTMEGSLVGCWWIDTGNDAFHPSGTLRSTGTERFTGCLDVGLDGTCDPGDPWGTFWTTYIFTAKFDANLAELHGRCGHPIVAGDGGFDGATGMLTFKDDVATGIAYYKGTIKMDDGGAARIASAHAATRSAARAVC